MDASTQPENKIPRTISVRTFADAMDVAPITVYRWERDGLIRGLRIGGMLRFAIEDVREFIARAAAQPRRQAPRELLEATRRPRRRRRQ